ncbi:MAG: hypothetical protein Ct9H90mP4_00150 [Gammaproteobacteria bacterium]|nr:MAG: hypothetical protein Ct9H90mP4_00150 [Gammaproteobacteria bacterium]
MGKRGFPFFKKNLKKKKRVKKEGVMVPLASVGNKEEFHISF